MKTTLRFKTDQELEADKLYHWNPKMDYLVGCKYFGHKPMLDEYAKHLTDSHNDWEVHDLMLTNEPHPYAKGNWVVKVENYNEVQAKALACGFKWYNRKIWAKSFCMSYLYIKNGILSQGATIADIKTFTFLNQKQFMEGYDPNIISDKAWCENFSELLDAYVEKKGMKTDPKYMCLMEKDNRAKYHDVSFRDMTALIPDIAIIKSDELKEPYHIRGFDQALKKGYIPLSQKEFMKRFPPKNEITLFGCAVRKTGSTYYIGSKNYSKCAVDGFLKIQTDYLEKFGKMMSGEILGDISIAVNKVNEKK